MCTKQRWMIGLTLSAFVLFPGCLDKYEVTTLVSTDGTCERVITLRRDSRNLPSGAFPVPVDSTWECTWTEQAKKALDGKGDGGKEYVYTARKRFPDYDALNREYRDPSDPASLSIHIRIEEKFRWFYTYYAYSETYRRFDPLRDPLQPSAFMTDEEIQRFMSNEKPDSLLEAKWKLWDRRKKDEWAFARLVDEVRKLNDPALPVGLFEQNKERLIRALSRDSTSRKGPTPGKAQKGVPSPKGGPAQANDEVLEALASVLDNKAVRGLRRGLDSLAEEFLRRDSISSRANGEYTNSVVLPGLIVETNAQEVRGATVVWRFTHEHLALTDYRMTAESRVVNLWAMIVSGVAVLLMVAFPALLRRRGRI